jgi:hypothetical protein
MGRGQEGNECPVGKLQENGVAYWCSREGGCSEVCRCMGRGRGQEGNETLRRMMIPTDVAGRRV